MARPPRSPEVVNVLAEFGAIWREKVDAVQVEEHAMYTSLRLVKGDRDVDISLDGHDWCVYVATGKRAADETDEGWLSEGGHWGRPLWSLEQFVQQRYSDEGERRETLRRIGRGVDRFEVDQVRRFLVENFDLLESFIEECLDLKSKTEGQQTS